MSISLHFILYFSTMSEAGLPSIGATITSGSQWGGVAGILSPGDTCSAWRHFWLSPWGGRGDVEVGGEVPQASSRQRPGAY